MCVVFHTLIKVTLPFMAIIYFHICGNPGHILPLLYPQRAEFLFCK